ncbi:2OG-Fe(II)-dependent halogenase WelO5 family protein [Photorhabdus sp. RW14-46]|uniref:2OG-Fe(II)-dependent halogenase WelO5 family protein n=1 Tax=Photorhabdus sp. RW14-46 TaxID=2100168 RepID=UPI0030D7983B
MTGVSECSQQRGNLKDDGYKSKIMGESTIMQEKFEIRGATLAESEFMIYETSNNISVHALSALLDGHLAACRVRNFLPSEQSRKIIENFWCSSARTPRYGEGIEGVEGYFIGASHIEKDTRQYIEEAENFRSAINEVFQDTINPIDRFIDQIVHFSSNNLRVMRPAMYHGVAAGNVKIVYWNNFGEFLLLPHDDLAQLSDPRQSDFEIQQINRVMAVNFYADVPQNGGQLKVWNIQPDDQSRSALGLTYSGFPYPSELLEDHASMVINIEAGDLVLLNGNLVHAVLNGNTISAPERRLLVTCFMGLQQNGDLIWWT